MILFFILFFSCFSAIMQIQGQKQEVEHCGETLHTPSTPSSEFIMALLWTLKNSCHVVDDLNPLKHSHSFADICDKACFPNCRFFGGVHMKTNALDSLKTFRILLLHHKIFMQWIPQRLNSSPNQHPFWVNQFFSTGFSVLRHRGTLLTHKQHETKIWAEAWCSSTVFQLNWKKSTQ